MGTRSSTTSAARSQNQYRTAIILVDYPDQPFLITQAPGTHPFGNPQPGWTPVAPEDVKQWMYSPRSRTSTTASRRSTATGWRTATADWHRRRGLRPVHDGRQVVEYGLATDFNSPVGNQADSSAPRATVQPEHPQRRPRRLAGGHGLRQPDGLRLQQRLLRDRRPRRILHVAGVRRDALDRPDAGPGESGVRRRERPGAEQRRQPDPQLGAHALRALDVLARGREPLAERGRRHLHAGGELRAERLRPRVQPSARVARQLQQPLADNVRNFTGYWR